MAAKKAKETGKDGIDRWTGNGYGMTFGKRNITPEQAKEIDKAAAKKPAAPKKPNQKKK